MRHSASSVALARTLHAEQGLIPSKVHYELRRRGIDVSLSTVMAWLDEEFRQKRNTARVRAERVHRKAKSRQAVDKAMVEMRREGNLSYEAIAYVVRRYHQVPMTEDKARRRCYAAGVQKNPKKVAQAVQFNKGRMAA